MFDQFLDLGFRDADGLVGRVVEHLDLELVLWILEVGHGFHEVFRYIEFVEHR